jgi:hypothetical protein
MSQPTDPKGSSHAASEQPNSRRTRRRRRTLLNLGMPFIQVDEFLNQSEDAVALGYRVLEQAVKEIQAGYDRAKEFNRDQEAFLDGKKPAPSIPWKDLVTRAQNLQNIAFDAIRDGTDILFDSFRAGTEAFKSVATTFEQSRADVDAMPVLAGPVFEEPIEITTWPGDRPVYKPREITHRGLARLRIKAEVNPELQLLKRLDTKTKLSGSDVLKVTAVSFDPIDDDKKPDVSVLNIEIGEIGEGQMRGTYEGLIRAKNFELLIAKLRVVVKDKAPETSTETTPRAEAQRETRAGTTAKRRGQRRRK